jgi:ribonuclease D
MISAPSDDTDDGDDDLQAHSKWELVANNEDLHSLTAKIRDAGLVAVDLETTGLNPRKDRVRLISISTTHGTWLVNCFEVDPSPLFPDLAEKRLVFHNAIFDLGFLMRMGFELGDSGEVIDTMLMSQVTENQETAKNKETV